MNDQRIRYLILTFVTFWACLALLSAAPVLGNDGGPERGQTWPSRTPTPAGPRPTQDPQATATSEPGPTASRSQETPVSGSTPVAGNTTIPSGGTKVSSPGPEGALPGDPGSIELPSAATIGDCGFPPLVLALGPVGVRSGPGIAYETVGSLAFQEERLIAGRAATAPWWLIQFSAEQRAWVSDLAVTVVGYTGAVPVMAIDDNASTGQPLWQPTPNPLCTPPAQETIAAGEALVASVAAGVDLNPGAGASGTASPSPVAGASAVDDTTPGLTLLEPESTSPGTNLIWLPVIGAILILAGLIGLIVQRRKG